MKKLERMSKSVFSILLIICILFSQGAVNNTYAAVKSISGMADWTGVNSFYSDPVGDGGGKGQSTDITGLGIVNDSSKIYVRWDVIIGNSGVNGLSSEYMVSFAPVGTYLDAGTNLKIDVSLTKGAVTAVKAFYAANSGTSSFNLSSSDATVVFDNNNTSSGAVAHILLAVPYTEIQNLPSISANAVLGSNSKRYIWGGSASSNVSISSAYTDVVPNGGGTSQNILSYDAVNGSSTPIMTTNPLITMNVVANNPIVASGTNVNYTLYINNQGAATNLYSISWAPNSSAFTYVSMGGTGSITTAPTSTANPVTWNLSSTPVVLASNSITTLNVNVRAGATASSTPYYSEIAAEIGSTSSAASQYPYNSGATAYTTVSSSSVTAPSINSSGSTTNSVTIGWTSVAAAASYNIYVDGIKLASTSGTSYTVNGLYNNTTYAMTVTAVNASNSESVSSNISYVTTASSKLITPASLTWDGTVPGKATWGSVNNMSSYTIQLYKGGVAYKSAVTGVTNTYYDFTSTIESAGTGAYTFKVTAVGDGTNYTDSNGSTTSSAYNYVTPAVKLTGPGNLSWDGTVPGKATWGSVSNASSYTIQLLKDGVAYGSAVTGVADSYYDFTSAITSAGSGAYTFTVTSIGDGTVYTDSDAVTVGSAYNYTDSNSNSGGDNGGNSGDNGNNNPPPAVKLTGPGSLSWDGSTPGKSTWGSVSNAGSYTIQLLKDGVAYGSAITGVADIYYDFTSVITSAGSGAYTFTVTAIGDGTNYTDSDAVTVGSAYNYTDSNSNSGGDNGGNSGDNNGGNSGDNGNNNPPPAVKLTNPGSLGWDGSTPGKATWGSVSNAGSYTIQLLKDGVAYGSAVTGVTDAYYDFTSVITSAGSGAYTFAVTAIGDGTNYTDSDAVTVGSAYNYTDSNSNSGGDNGDNSGGNSGGNSGDNNGGSSGDNNGGNSGDNGNNNPPPAVKLTNPGSLSWDGSSPGKATWGSVSSAGSYTIQLLKDGVAYGSVVTGVADAYYDFTSVITSAGSGAYTFTITAIGDGSNYTNSDAVTVANVYNYAASTYSVSGTVKDDTNLTVQGATVRVKAGRTTVGSPATTDANGYFTVTGIPNGTYNLVVTYGDVEIIESITVNGSNFVYSGQIILPTGKKASKMNLVGAETPDIVETGLNSLFNNNSVYTPADQQVVDNGGSVEIKLTVQKNENSANKATVVAELTSQGYAAGLTMDIDITKTVQTNGGGTTNSNITATGDFITLIIPLPASLQGKTNYVVSRAHMYNSGLHVDTITSTPNGLGEYLVVNNDKTQITLYAKLFSTYVIAYQDSSTVNPAPTATPPITISALPTDENPSVEKIDLDILQGGSDITVAKLTLERATGEDGQKTDLLTLTKEQAKEIVNKLKEAGQDTAVILVPDPKQEISETKIMIPAESSAILAAGGINLQFGNGETVINISGAILGSTGLKDDRYFRLIRVGDAATKTIIAEHARQEAAKISTNENSKITVLGSPYTVVSNLEPIVADITIPLKGIIIPSNVKDRAALSKLLAVYVEYTDGTGELLQGELVKNKDGNYGIRLHVTKLGTYTVIKTDAFVKSSACDVVSVLIPDKAAVSGLKIKATVSEQISSTVIKVTVSTKAKWELYRDKAGKQPVAGRQLKLKTGENIAYLKVTAEDGNSKIYQVTIIREKASVSEITKVMIPEKSTIEGTTISAEVTGSTDSLAVKVTVSNNGSWRLYLDKECTKEVADKKLMLKTGINQAYIRVTADNGKDSKVYTLTITRKEVQKNRDIQYKVHVMLGLIGKKSYSETVASIFEKEYPVRNVHIVPEGEYYRVYMDFASKKAAREACKDMIKRQYIVNYYFIQ